MTENIIKQKWIYSIKIYNITEDAKYAFQGLIKIFK